MKVGDRVKLKWLKGEGTIIAAEQPLIIPLLTAHIELEARFKVKWDSDEYGESDWLRESEFVKS